MEELECFKITETIICCKDCQSQVRDITAWLNQLRASFQLNNKMKTYFCILVRLEVQILQLLIVDVSESFSKIGWLCNIASVYKIVI